MQKGKILVIGGGISGIEASLQLSSLGYGVYLVERSGDLGGKIPDLHRIYPICSCCKLNTKVFSCKQDPNIKVMLNTEVESIEGEFGKFEVTLKEDGNFSKINVAGIVISGGFEPFDPSVYENYAYSHPNVLTSLEYEKMQKPFSEGIKRPSDGKVPERIAWIQCVGSRDINRCDAPYCSSVCCMYALKEALNTKEINEKIDTAIFYMDMRAHGKGFERYMNDALEKGVRLVRCRIHTVEPNGDRLILRYVDEKGEPYKEEFDLVVLSVGLRPSKETVEIAKKLNLELDEAGFIKTDLFGRTNVSGIFACGSVCGPCDINQAIVQADSVALTVSSLIEPEPFSSPERPPEIRDIKDEEPKILFAYHICPEMKEAEERIERVTKDLDLVKVLKVEDIKGEISSSIKETSANRVIFASCTPSVHKKTVEEALRSCGLNPYLYETVDLRLIETDEQLKERILYAIYRLKKDLPLPVTEIPVEKHALVIGGGLSGLEAAVNISEAGYPVTIVEKTGRLGGHALYVKETWDGMDIKGYVRELISKLEKSERVNIMLNTEVERSIGTAGRFLTTLVQDGKRIQIRHAVTVIATGGEVARTDEYLYGKSDKVYLWSELSKKLLEEPEFFKSIKSAVFIQCVGSRDKDHPYCSNICCSFSVKTALELKKLNPDMDIYIINRDIRTFGMKEILYREARKSGIVFIRYDLERRPKVEEKDGKLNITVFDPILQRDILIEADLLSLQTAIEPNTNEISEIFGIAVDQDGFFRESPEKMKPVDSTKEGIFVIGIANYPKDAKECIEQARAASSRAISILKKESIVKGGAVAEVDPGKCAVCCTCVRTCPFHVPYIDHSRGAAYIDPALCVGCGICVAECPGKAIKMPYLSDQMLLQTAEILLKE